MTRERFNWISDGLIVGIALAMLGITTSRGEDVPRGRGSSISALASSRPAPGDGFLASYDGSDAAKAQAAAKMLDDNANSMLPGFPRARPRRRRASRRPAPRPRSGPTGRTSRPR
jgi:hypothetical protein